MNLHEDNFNLSTEKRQCCNEVFVNTVNHATVFNRRPSPCQLQSDRAGWASRQFICHQPSRWLSWVWRRSSSRSTGSSVRVNTNLSVEGLNSALVLDLSFGARQTKLRSDWALLPMKTWRQTTKLWLDSRCSSLTITLTLQRRRKILSLSVTL